MRDDAKVIEDSLFALSKRVPQLQAAVNREMNLVNENMDQALEQLAISRADQRGKPQAADKQQRAMTSLNNLALLLDEALQQMQADTATRPARQRQLQKARRQGQQARRQQEDGPDQGQSASPEQTAGGHEEGLGEGEGQGPKPGDKNPGDGKPGMDGKPGTGGMPGMSQQLAQLAAQQAAIRKEMQRAAQELNKDGRAAATACRSWPRRWRRPRRTS